MIPKASLIAIAIATAVSLSYASPSFAQAGQPVVTVEGAPGTVIGSVKEAARGVYLQGARISVDGKQAVTERDGSFRVTGLAPGRHRVSVDFLGYQPQEVEIEVGASSGARVDLTLYSTTAGSADAVSLDRVEVRGIRDAQALALNQQRSAVNYTNVVSADLLGQFPDNNIAESTQRIPGVSIERDQGEGRYVTVRGAPKEFTTVTIDGVPLANPDSTSRGVELDTIPSDVISALEVTKAITPDMDGDAIAGNINIRTKSALDRDGLTLNASMGLGKYQLGNGANERFNATVGHRFGANENIGVLISGSLSKQGRFTDNVETTYEQFLNPDGTVRGIFPTGVEIKDYEGTRTRTGLTGRFDYRIDPGNLIYFVASDANFKDREFRDNLIIEMDRHTPYSGVDAPDSNQTTGNVRATFDKELRERTYDKNIRTYNLGGEHYVGDAWKFDWQVSQSKAEKTTDPRMQFIFRSTVRPRMEYDYTDPDFPIWTILGRPDAPATGVNLPESWFGFRRLNDRWEYSEEKETGFRFDVDRALPSFSDTGNLKFGVRVRQRDKLFDDERRRNGTAADFNALGITMSDMLCNEYSNNFDYFLTGRRFCRNIFDRWAGPLLESDNHNRLIPDSITADYRAEEDVNAGYVRLDGQWNKLTMIAGVRYERTKTHGEAIGFDNENGEITPLSAGRSYSNVLPSLHFRYEVGSNGVLRASYSTALNRPDFMNTAPYRVLAERDLSGLLEITEGNPNVKEAVAQSLDLSYEYYIRPLGLVSLAAFYKRIDDPLFIATRTEPYTGTLPGIDRQRITRAENGSNGRLEGVEFAWQQTFDRLPSPFDGVGLYANYTYAKSRAELPFNRGSTELPGTSRTNYNLALTYDKYGINARLAYNYRSKFIQTFDVATPELNVYWDERDSLDFSAEYDLSREWRVFLEVNNINDVTQIRFQGDRSRVLEMEQFGRSWLAGFRYKF